MKFLLNNGELVETYKTVVEPVAIEAYKSIDPSIVHETLLPLASYITKIPFDFTAIPIAEIAIIGAVCTIIYQAGKFFIKWYKEERESRKAPRIRLNSLVGEEQAQYYIDMVREGLADVQPN